MLKVGVFVVDGGGQRRDSSLSYVTRSVNKGNIKLSLVQLWTTIMCVVSY